MPGGKVRSVESQAATSGLEHKAASNSALTIAFQPIADLADDSVFAYDAIVCGPRGETGTEIFEALKPEQRAMFDRRCAIGAIRWSMAAGLGNTTARLSLPFHAQAITNPTEHIEAILQTAKEAGLEPERLIFALHGYYKTGGTELADIVDVHRKAGALTAFVGVGQDNIGLGACGRYSPDLVTLEPELVSPIALSWYRRLVLEELTPKIRSLGVRIVGTGVDSEAVFQRLGGFGIYLAQGGYIAGPEVNALPNPVLRSAA